MKNLLALLLAILTVFALAACGEKPADGKKEEPKPAALSADNAWYDPVKREIEMYYHENYDDLMGVVPQKIWDHYSGDTNRKIEDYKRICEYNRKDMEAIYGKKLKVTFKPTAETAFTKEEMDMVVSELVKIYGLDAAKITEAKELKYEMSVTGDNKSGVENGVMNVVCYDGVWYKIVCTETEDFLYASFVFVY